MAFMRPHSLLRVQLITIFQSIVTGRNEQRVPSLGNGKFLRAVSVMEPHYKDPVAKKGERATYRPWLEAGSRQDPNARKPPSTSGNQRKSAKQHEARSQHQSRETYMRAPLHTKHKTRGSRPLEGGAAVQCTALASASVTFVAANHTTRRCLK